jgi:hypothetical protein
MPPERRMGASDFKIEWEPMVKTTETLRWTHQQAKYEIHVVLLEKVELCDILPLCLGVLHKLDGQVGLEIEERRILSSSPSKNHVYGSPIILEASSSGI